MRGLFFLKLGIFFKSCALTVISSNIIQVWAEKLIEKASAHPVDLISSPKYIYLHCWGLISYIGKYWPHKTETEAKILNHSMLPAMVKLCFIASNH